MSQSRPVADMSPPQRRQAVAAILARGVLRCRGLARKTISSPAQKPPDWGSHTRRVRGAPGAGDGARAI